MTSNSKILKSTILFLVVVLFQSLISYGQNEISNSVFQELKAGTTPSSTYIPVDQSVFTRSVSSTIVVNYLETPDNKWPFPAKNAFDYAINIWEHTITSPITIVIDAKWEPISGPTIARAGSVKLMRNFGSNNPNYQASTWYGDALADKLNGSDRNPGNADITITIDKYGSGTGWYFGNDGNCPSNKFDFITVVLHEISHGLSLTSSAQQTPGYPPYLNIGGSPFIMDRFLTDNNGNLALNNESLLTSNNLWWNGTDGISRNSGNRPKMYAPSTFSQGSSIMHLDENTYLPGTANAIFTPELYPGEVIHNPGQLVVGLLNDIGWDAEVWTGIEDNLEIKNYNYGTPTTLLDVGSYYSYRGVFTDEYPYGDYMTGYNWNLELLHSTGKYILSSSTGSTWSFTLPNLPSGYKWVRNYDGTVRANLKVYGYDNDGIYHEDVLSVAINYKPNDPDIRLEELPPNTCHYQQVSFYSEGTTTYQLQYRPYYTSTYININIVPGDFEYTINGLNTNIGYYFRVKASNSYGSTYSEVKYRSACTSGGGGGGSSRIGELSSDETEVILYPNVASDYIILNSNSEIKSVEFINILNQSAKQIEIKGKVNEIQIDLSYLVAGTYIAKITDFSGDIFTKKFMKQ